MLKAHLAKWMIWEGEQIKEPADKLKSLGIQSLVFDPCGNVKVNELNNVPKFASLNMNTPTSMCEDDRAHETWKGLVGVLYNCRIWTSLFAG